MKRETTASDYVLWVIPSTQWRSEEIDEAQVINGQQPEGARTGGGNVRWSDLLSGWCFAGMGIFKGCYVPSYTPSRFSHDHLSSDYF